jgi:hypothetical protein
MWVKIAGAIAASQTLANLDLTATSLRDGSGISETTWMNWCSC